MHRTIPDMRRNKLHIPNYGVFKLRRCKRACTGVPVEIRPALTPGYHCTSLVDHEDSKLLNEQSITPHNSGTLPSTAHHFFDLRSGTLQQTSNIHLFIIHLLPPPPNLAFSHIPHFIRPTSIKRRAQITAIYILKQPTFYSYTCAITNSVLIQ
jgi:hypothetical protein